MDTSKEFTEANNLLKEAEIKIKGSCLSNLCKSLNDRKVEAIPLFEKAGVLFKIAGKWPEAAKCYLECAEVSERNRDDPINYYEETAGCYEKFDKKRQYDILNILIMMYEKDTNYDAAAKVKEDMGNIEEKENKFDNAIKNYLKAADYYSMDKSNNMRKKNTALLKSVDLMCQIDHQDAFVEGTRNYEEIGLAYLKANKYEKEKAYECFFKSVCLFLAYKDEITADAYLNKYLSEDYNFESSDEYKALFNMIEGFKDQKPNLLQRGIKLISKKKIYDNWKIAVFSKITSKLPGGQDNDFKDDNNIEVVVQNEDIELNWR